MKGKSILLLMLIFANVLACKKDIAKTAVTPIIKPESEDFYGKTLSADGKTDTYKLINGAFAGTGDVLETPDCAHPEEAPHIKQIYDNDLKKYVFAFTIHVTPDNDRCIEGVNDRQRNEIKTYAQSPDSLLASQNEMVNYSWKFKIDKDFQPSPNFTHLHQLKALDGDDALPLITFTARYKSSGNTLEVIHTGGTGKSTSLKYLASIPLSGLAGEWVEVHEKATFSYDGNYLVKITRISDQKELLNININHIDLWRDGTTRCRPKWGIYRSLLYPSYLRTETVRFNDFNINEHNN